LSDVKDPQPSEYAPRLVEWLQEAGYRASLSDSKRTTIFSGASGLKFIILTYPSSIQFYMGMKITKDEITCEDCNEENKKWRFTKIYLDSEGDLVLEMDLYLAFDGSKARDTFVEAVELWDSALGRVKAWVSEHMKD
jgi:hypothetical protein